MRLRPRQGLLLGIAVLAAASVVLDVALGRAWAALLGTHVAVTAPGLILAGAGLGAVVLATMPGLVRREALLSHAALLAGLASAGTLAALLVMVHVKVPDALDRTAAVPAAIVYATSILPFVFAGMVVAAAVRHVPVIAGRVVFAVFAGAALGAPLALGALRAGALRAGLTVLEGYAVASLLFYLAAKGADASVERPRGAFVATFVLAAAVLLAGDIGAPWLKLPSFRFTPLDKVEFQEWSGLGLTTVDRVQGGVSWIHTDGIAGLPIYDAKTAVPISPDELAYAIARDPGPVAVLGGGGGREVRTAVKYGQKEIYAVEQDPVLVRAIMLDRVKKASGEVYDNPAVKVVLEDARGFVKRSGVAFRNIVVVQPDSGPAQAIGALARFPEALYTVEAVSDLVVALAPDGTLMLTRLDAESDHLLALALAALRRIGSPEPAQHIFGCSFARFTTLLVRRSMLTPGDTAQLRAFCRKNKMNEVFAPDLPHSDVHRRLVAQAALDPSAAGALSAAGEAGDLRAAMDDRPFFSAGLPGAAPLQTLTQKTVAAANQGALVVAAQVAVALLLLFFAFGFPFARAPRSTQPRLGPLFFFLGLGGSAALAAAGLLPRVGVLLGHPIYGYTSALPVLVASTAVGGLVVGRVRAAGAEAPAGRRAELLVAVLAFVAVGLQPLAEAALALPFGLRFAAGVVLLMPVGLLVGSLFALGIRLVGARSPEVIPWCVGIAGVGAFFASAVAELAAPAVGYSALVLLAGAAALLAAVCVPRAAQPQD